MSAAPKPEAKGTSVDRIHPKIGLTRSLLERMQPHFAQVLPEHLTPERMVRLTLLAMNRQPELLDCTAESIAEAVMQISSWGLEIGRTAHLVAFGKKATALADYKGKIELAIRSHTITSCRARVVYEADQFEVEYGLVEKLTHRPAWNTQRGNPIGVYAVVMLPNGESKFELMSTADVEKIRQRSKAKDSGPWKTDPEEMAKKTVVHRLLKMIPQSPQLAAAFEAEEYPEEPEQVTIRQTPRVRSGGYEEDGAVRATGAAAFGAGKPSAETVSSEETDEEVRAEERRMIEQEGRA
jgi:recombination protein RecT